MANPAAAVAPVTISTRRTPIRLAILAPNAPAMKPTIPWGAMARPVISGESFRTCWKYSESISISPPFHRPRSTFSTVAVRSSGRLMIAAGSSGSGWCRSATTKAPMLATHRASAPRIAGERQPDTPACETA